MQAKPEDRRSERFGHDYIVKYLDDLSPTSYYAVSCNLSERGICLKSQFELYPGVHIFIRIEDYSSDQNQVPARVVWCKALENTGIFRYEVGVEFLKSEKNSDMKASPQDDASVVPGNKKRGGVVIKLKERSSK